MSARDTGGHAMYDYRQRPTTPEYERNYDKIDWHKSHIIPFAKNNTPLKMDLQSRKMSKSQEKRLKIQGEADAV